MSIQSSINQMLSSIANQQLFKGLTTKVGEIKTDTGNITAEQKRFNELIKKHGSLEDLESDADKGKQEIENEIKLREEYPDIDKFAEEALRNWNKILGTQTNPQNAAQEVWRRTTNIAQTRTNMYSILAEDTQDTVKERYEQSKGGAQK